MQHDTALWLCAGEGLGGWRGFRVRSSEYVDCTIRSKKWILASTEYSAWFWHVPRGHSLLKHDELITIYRAKAQNRFIESVHSINNFCSCHLVTCNHSVCWTTPISYLLIMLWDYKFSKFGPNELTNPRFWPYVFTLFHCKPWGMQSRDLETYPTPHFTSLY